MVQLAHQMAVQPATWHFPQSDLTGVTIMSANHSTRVNPRVKDLTGQTFGRLTVIGFSGIRGDVSWWRCKCECGEEAEIRSTSLRNGHTKSCGCKSNKPENLTGRTFGRLTVIKPDSIRGSKVRWICRCECGARVSIAATKLKSDETRSCGCYRKEWAADFKSTHGLTRIGNHHPMHTGWCQMRARCQDPTHAAYPSYGARGITVCERWERFENFLADMGERPAGLKLDRIDNNGPYSPENCRWADDTTQARNRRSNKRYKLNDESFTLPEWSEKTGVSASLLHARIHRLGWSVDKALVTPTRRCQRGNNSQ